MRLAASVLVLALLAPSAAWACGGFFCGTVPVDQTGEQILFVDLGDTIQATVSIAYQGDTADFAWVIPVPGVPDLAVGSDQVFAALRNATAPSYSLSLGASTCDLDTWWSDELEDDADGGDDDDQPTNGGGGVSILLEESVGDYEAFVVGAQAAQPLMDWLNCNGFRIASSALPLVEAYIADGMNFLALRLDDARPSGALTPIVMEYRGERPMVPIVLTAVATQPNLALRVHFAGSTRAVPLNYDVVWPNEALVDWSQPWSAGRDAAWSSLVTRAVDDVGGRAFVPEFAGPRPAWLLDQLGPVGGWQLDPLRAIADPARFLDDLLATGVPRTGLMQELIRRHIPMPQALLDDGVTEQQFYNNLEAYRAWLGSIAFNADAFVTDVIELVTGPIEAARITLDTPERTVLSTLVTSLSGWEMDTDPVFGFLPEGGSLDPVGADFPRRGGVPQLREATFDLVGGDAQTSCYEVANVVRTGGPVDVIRQFAAKGIDDGLPPAGDLPLCQDLPAALASERWTPDGEVEVAVDRRDAIALAAPAGLCVWTASPEEPTDPPDGVVWPPDGELMPLVVPPVEVCEAFESLGGTAPLEPVAGCGCATAQGSAPAASLGLGLWMIAAGRRRRR